MRTEPTVFLNGLFLPLPLARISVVDRGFSYGDGLFETMRSYNGKIFKLDAHLERLFQSLDLIYLNVPMTVGEMKSAIGETLIRNGQADCMIRLTVSRGEQSSGFHLDPAIAPTLVILVRPLEALPREWYQQGINISLFPSTAQKVGGLGRPVKSCNYLSNVIIRELAHRQNSIEGVMIDDHGRVTEGTTSNVFIVKQGTLITPEINEHILPGITRQAVLDIAVQKEIPVTLQALTADDIYHAEEVFITNSRIEILPVKQADERTIGEGRPGPMTRLLHEELLKSIEGGN
jgi:branched-chain amino acid aminotransferase